MPRDLILSLYIPEQEQLQEQQHDRGRGVPSNSSQLLREHITVPVVAQVHITRNPIEACSYSLCVQAFASKSRRNPGLVMSHEVDPRRTAGERASEEEVDELPTDHHLERDPANEQLSEDYPHPKRRRPPSLTGTTERPTLADQGATTPRAGPATTGLLDQPSGGDVRQDLDYPQSITDIGKAYKNNGVSQLEAGHRQPESATQTGSFPDRPKPSSSAGLSQNSSAFSLARLPSLSSIAQDLPPNTLATRQSPKEFSSPVSNRSRNSISSRGSSPHASSSSSSSSTGKRRFGSIAADTGAVSRSASQVPE